MGGSEVCPGHAGLVGWVGLGAVRGTAELAADPVMEDEHGDGYAVIETAVAGAAAAVNVVAGKSAVEAAKTCAAAATAALIVWEPAAAAVLMAALAFARAHPPEGWESLWTVLPLFSGEALDVVYLV